jgi:predicted ATP-grasp superfamily ATP-dependent carboligase
MDTFVLLVSTIARRYATARIPRALANAGFAVAALTPKSALVEASAYVTKIGHLPDNATPMQWVFAFAAMVKATTPRLVVPGDDAAFRLLCSLAAEPPANMVPAMQAQLASLIRESLGDPSWYRASADKLLLPAAVEALGLRVPPYAIVASAQDAAAFAATHGYPVVLKRRHGFGGPAAVSCSDETAIAPIFAELARLDALDPEGRGDGRLLVQAPVRGERHPYALVAWQGESLAGWSSDVVATDRPPMGAPTVLRLQRSDALADLTSRLVRGFGMSGFVTLEWIVEEGTGNVYLGELSRAVAPSAHCGAAHGVDLAAALFAAAGGAAIEARTALDPGEAPLVVLFPQEWLRDPESPYLLDYPVDVPWDDPKLLEALLALAPEAAPPRPPPA